MPATTNKQQLLNQVFTALKKKYGEPAEPEPRTILEHLIYAICREAASRDLADQGFRALQERFFDWNEVRVSSPHEIEEALAGLSGRPERAHRILGVLQYWFELDYSFNMESLAKKGVKDAARQLGRMLNQVSKDAARQLTRSEIVNDFVVAWVTQQGLGGHAIPLDSPTLVALKRLGVIEGESDNPEELRSTVEHFVPKARGPQFIELLNLLTRDLCYPSNPNCSACPLHNDCPTGVENLRNAPPEPKPRKSR